MSRKKKLFLNIIAGLSKQITMVVCGFILPRYMLLCFGSTVTGLVSSITHFLSFINFLDLGVGAVVQSNLYTPLANKDNAQISRIVKSSERFFRKLAGIFICYIVLLCFIFPPTVSSSFDTWFTASLIIIISINLLAQFLFGITNQILLNADQKAYVQLTLQIGTIALNTFLAVLLMRLGASIHIVKLMSAVVFVLKPLGLTLYVQKHYKIEKDIVLVGEPIQQKWNGFSQHAAAVLLDNVGIAALTFFSTLQNVSIYYVYSLVTNGLTEIVMRTVTGLEALFGNLLASKEKEKLLRIFEIAEWLIHTGVTIIFTIAAITVVPFVSVYTKGITDANYQVPFFGALLLSTYAIRCLRFPYFGIVKAAKHFKETQIGAFVSAGLNIVITFALVSKYGLVGAASGSLVAQVFHTFYLVWYLKLHILKRPPINFIRYFVTDLFIAVISYYLTCGFILKCTTYVEFVVLAIDVTLVVLAVSIVVNLLLYETKMRQVLYFVRQMQIRKQR